MSERLPALIEEMNTRIGRQTDEFEAVLPRGVTVAQLKQDALNCLRVTPKLAECFIPSVLGGLMTCAQLGLRPGVAGLGHAWLLPMKNWKERRTDAQVIIGYRGYSDLAYRHPKVVAVQSNIVRRGDMFEMDLGQDLLVHRMPTLGTDRGPVLGFYALAQIQGEYGTQRILTEPMSQAEMQEHRDKYAMAKKDGGVVGPWRDHFNEMGRKTMIRVRLVKSIPVALDLATGLAVDEGVRTDFDPSADPARVTERIEPEETEPTQPIRESVTLRRPPTGGLTGDQDRRIIQLVRERGLNKEQALALVKETIGEAKSARQLTEDEANRVIARLEAIPLPTMEGDVVQDGRPAPERGPIADMPRQASDRADALNDAAQQANRASRGQMNKLHALLAERGITDDNDVRTAISDVVGVEITTRTKVTPAQAHEVIDHYERLKESTEQQETPRDDGQLVRADVVAEVRAEWQARGGTIPQLTKRFEKAMSVSHLAATAAELAAFLEQLRAEKHQP
ncbi:recombinase RecT [Nonomuraea sp. NPDC050394]|uniref:recombinase RecT n=1 Tax=Nonomuraea sp. NPDC050394 TaxID=3364363 RepID=UPI0037967096